MTFKELVDDALDACGYDTTLTSSAPRTRLKRYVNFWHRRFLTRPVLQRFLRTVYNHAFASVASEPIYGMPLSLARIRGVRETDNDVALTHREMAWLRNEDPGLTASGTPHVYVPLGWFATLRPLSAAGTVWAKLDGAGTQTLRFTVLRANGETAASSLTLNATTAVQFGSLTDITDVLTVTLDAASSARLTITETSGVGTTLGTLVAGGLALRYFRVQLWPTPTGVITYYLDYERVLADLVNDTDVPLMPEDFHDMLSLGAQIEEWVRKDDTRWELAERRMKLREADLTNWLWNLPDAHWGRSDPPRHSRLGAWFPAGS